MRRLGAQDAMEQAGLTFDDRLYGLSNYDFESAYHAMNSLLARRAEFTALFAMSDVIAFGAIRALVTLYMKSVSYSKSMKPELVFSYYDSVFNL